MNNVMIVRKLFNNSSLSTDTNYMSNIFLCVSLLLLSWTASFSYAASGDDGLYHTYDEIGTEFNTLVNAYPNLAIVENIGTSIEGRDIRAIKISDNSSINENEPEILFVGGHHAREWISVDVPFYLAKYLLENYNTDNYIKQIVDNEEIWIVPLLNPDGHHYSVEVDALWRKNRRNNGDGSFGVDLNRNYDFHWGEFGSINIPESGMYRGPSAFSEPETQALKDFISINEFQCVISYHNFGQFILYPWGYTYDTAPDYTLMANLASTMSNEIISVFGTDYTPLQISELYISSGDLTDWSYGALGIPSFTIELRPNIVGGDFNLPEDQIDPTFEENLPAALFMIDWTRGEVDLNPPVAEANGPYSGNDSSPITFDANGSHDTNGNIFLYEWDFDNDGTYDVSTTSVTTDHTYSSGYYGSVKLRVTDNDGLIDIDTAPAEIENGPEPVANAGPDQRINDNIVNLDGSGSFDQDGTIVSYEWSLVYRFYEKSSFSKTAENETPTVSDLAKGLYDVTLTVTDNEGYSDTDTMTVTNCFISTIKY